MQYGRLHVLGKNIIQIRLNDSHDTFVLIKRAVATHYRCVLSSLYLVPGVIVVSHMVCFYHQYLVGVTFPHPMQCHHLNHDGNDCC